MAEVTLSSKNQIVIPREARSALGLKSGDKLVAVVRGTQLLVLRKPQRHHEAIRGLTEPYPDDYLNEERRSWD